MDGNFLKQSTGTVETCTKHLILIIHKVRTKHSADSKGNEQIMFHHDRTNHSRAQKERNWSLDTPVFLQNSTWVHTEIHWHHRYLFWAAGHYCSYIFLSCFYAGQTKEDLSRPNISTSTSPPQLLLRSLCEAARPGSHISIQASSGKLLSAPPRPQGGKVSQEDTT